MRLEFKTTKLLLGVLYTGITAAIVVAVFLSAHKISAGERISLGGVDVIVAIADTQELQEKGLSGHKPLVLNEGMLFLFSKPTQVGFWMKDMLFPIDIIWFDENRRLVDLWENATPESYPQIHEPVTLSKYVLEVPAGFLRDHHIEKGDQFQFLPQ